MSLKINFTDCIHIANTPKNCKTVLWNGVERFLTLPSVGKRYEFQGQNFLETSQNTSSSRCLDVLKVIALTIIFPFTLIALVFRSYFRHPYSLQIAQPTIPVPLKTLPPISPPQPRLIQPPALRPPLPPRTSASLEFLPRLETTFVTVRTQIMECPDFSQDNIGELVKDGCNSRRDPTFGNGIPFRCLQEFCKKIQASEDQGFFHQRASKRMEADFSLIQKIEGTFDINVSNMIAQAGRALAWDNISAFLHQIHEIVPGIFLSGNFSSGCPDGLIDWQGDPIDITQGQPLKFGTIFFVTGGNREIRADESSPCTSNLKISLHGSTDISRDIGYDDFTFEKLHSAMSILLQTLIDGKSVLIKCSQGKDRSTAVCSTLIALLYDLNSVFHAGWFARTNRPIADPVGCKYSSICQRFLVKLKNDSNISQLIVRARRQIFPE